MRETPTELERQSTRTQSGTSETPPEHGKPRVLSQSDPTPESARGRPPLWLIIIVVLLVTGFVVLHLTGAVGGGAQ